MKGILFDNHLIFCHVEFYCGTFTVKVQLRVLQQHSQIHPNLGHGKLILHVMASTNFTLSTSICGFWVNYTSWWVHYKLNLLSSKNESIPLIYIQRCVQLECYPFFFVFPIWMHTSIWCLQVRKHRGVREVPTGLFQALELKDVERWTFEVLIPKLPTKVFK